MLQLLFASSRTPQRTADHAPSRAQSGRYRRGLPKKHSTEWDQGVKINNCTNSKVKEFNILAFNTTATGQIALFIGVLFMYLVTVIGNVIIIALVCLVSQLHTPMYFFLCNLSSADIAFVSVTLPKLLSIIVTKDQRISFQGCITQLYFLLLCGQADMFILTCMAYDRYVAVCKPLQYTMIMRKKVRLTMAVASWLIGTFNALLHALLASFLSFCSSNEIDHFFCDLKTLNKLSASDSMSRDILISIESAMIGCLPCSCIVVSYVYIISTILKIKSSKGRRKAFSSCTSHLTTVILFYGPIIFLYMKPQSTRTREDDKLLSFIYVAVVPMLNPLVYSLRNKDVLNAMAKVKLYLKSM
ncbi:olfactory receptor 1G1-like [Hyla sarda]|uniref:olfactory receptor 1G1-like n=1 Tax=Hyla sarda TaxID=327740 RepID=UPI0024C31667|nr:olfactory receptor 1G1-like [Hyla sarda]